MAPSFYFIKDLTSHLELSWNTGNAAIYMDLTGNDAHSQNSSQDKGASLFLPHTAQIQEVCSGGEFQ